MTRRGTHQYADEANLQADVMRFMAIVAFCLVAILAIVRNVEPPPMPLPDPTTPPQTERTLGTTAAIPTATDPVAAPVLHPYAAAVPRAVAPLNTEPAPQLERARLERSEQKQIPQPEPEPTAIPEPEPEPEKFSEPDSPTQVEQGLALKFASDSDFLRLLNKGSVTLYAISEGVYQKYDITHRFVPISPPKQYYEVVAATVPSMISNILNGASVTWAVGLPVTIERQITTHIARANSGELLINRFEQVHHVNVN